MKKLLVIIIICLINSVAFALEPKDTITNWQIYQDHDIILKGNIASVDAIPFSATIDLKKAFKLLKVQVNHDTYINNHWESIKLMLDNQVVFQTTTDKGLVIKKSDLLKVIKNKGEGTFLLLYSDNFHYKEGLYLGQLTIKK